jgi:hypothetical protein
MPAQISDFQAELDGVEHRTQQKLTPRLGDGVAWGLYKRIMRRPITAANGIIYLNVIRRLEVPSSILFDFIYASNTAQPTCSETRTACMIQIATDLHKAIILAGNLCIYSICWLVHTQLTGSLKIGILITACGWVLVRLVQMFTMVVAISFDPNYSCTDYARPAFNTLAHYLEIAGLFAIAYLAIASIDPEAFNLIQGTPSILSTPGSAYYFSHMTIATVSFGDIVPVKAIPRFAVACEILIGMFILIVILQRAFSAAGTSWANQPTTLPTNND